MSRRNSIIAGIILLILLVAGILLWKFRSSPKYSFLQIKSALDDHDFAKFEKYVDIEGIISSLTDQVFEIIKGKSVPQDPWEQLGQDFGAGLLNMFKPQLTVLYKQQIQNWVESGKLETQSPFPLGMPYSLPEIGRGVGAIRFTGIDYEKIDGPIATIGLGFKHEHFDTVLVINLKMRDKGGYWQVAELTELANFQMTLDKLEEKRVAEINRPIKTEMANSLKISNYDRSVKQDAKGNKRFQILIGLQNTSPKTILEYGAVLNITDAHQNVTKEIKIDTETSNAVPENLMPENKLTVTWPGAETEKNNPDSLLTSTPLSELSLRLTIDYIKFADGTSLRLHHKWEAE